MLQGSGREINADGPNLERERERDRRGCVFGLTWDRNNSNFVAKKKNQKLIINVCILLIKSSCARATAAN